LYWHGGETRRIYEAPIQTIGEGFELAGKGGPLRPPLRLCKMEPSRPEHRGVVGGRGPDPGTTAIIRRHFQQESGPASGGDNSK